MPTPNLDKKVIKQDCLITFFIEKFFVEGFCKLVVNEKEENSPSHKTILQFVFSELLVYGLPRLSLRLSLAMTHYFPFCVMLNLIKNPPGIFCCVETPTYNS